MKEFGFILSVVSWLATKGLDRLLAKWVAYFQIAWEDKASNEAKALFSASIQRVKTNLPEKAKAWDDWKKNASASP